MLNEKACESLKIEELREFGDEKVLDFYRKMLLIRRAEEKIANLIEEGKVVCPCHLYIGQEAIATGVCSNLNDDDYAYSTHRSHGHYLAKGGSLDALFAEIFGKETGSSRGNGGSMHLAAPETGFPGSSAIVGGTIPLAAGSALAFSTLNTKRVAVAFFGDGAATEGVLYETLNFAALKKLPVIFICENNFYSTHMHIKEIQADTEIFKRALAFGMPAERIDGNNVLEVAKRSAEAINKARQGLGPSFLECLTYRWRGHVGPKWDLDKGLRSKDEVDFWVGCCPIKRLEKALEETGLLTDELRSNITSEIDKQINSALEFAAAGKLPEVNSYRDKAFKGDA